ncbi:hypothetical protein [Lacticaseibacillus porcinae]|uniref:hypothetical protein n=1 Tax=Lacticaseibacillus porcinae TaxID=1123687 RepID=UPI000F792B07|nr:hypothetical protein [Lacticaseibacillus porcinae]
MMITQVVLTWYQQTWWVGTKEVLILLGFLVAAFTYRRNTVVRAQDVKAGQIQRTFELMRQYPGETRALVLKVTRQLDDVFNALEVLKAQGEGEDVIKQSRTDLLATVDLIELLHRIDPWGFLLKHPEHLFIDEAANTFSSELSRVLLDKRFSADIDQIMQQSSMMGIPELIEVLKKYEALSNRRF